MATRGGGVTVSGIAYVPQTGTMTVPARVEEKIVTGILNPLPAGTRVRATLGQSVLVGTIQEHFSDYAVVALHIDQVETDWTTNHLLDVTLWVDSGWEFEILAGVAS